MREREDDGQGVYSHSVLLVDLPDDFVHHELLLEELLIGLLSLTLLLLQLLLQLLLVADQLVVALLILLVLLHRRSLVLTLHLMGCVCFLALVSEREQ